MKYIDLFPTRIWKFSLNLDKERLLNDINEIRKNDPFGRNISNYGGWQSSDRTTEHLNYFKEKVESCFHSISEIRSHITEVWVNINENKNFNFPHLHPRVYLSGCYYVNLPENCNSPLILLDPRIQKTYSSFQDESAYSPQISEGEFIIFPSWLYHMVLPNESEEPRISIACNYGFN